MKLVIGNHLKVGFEEIKLAFLSAPGVDSKLLHPKWLENAFVIVSEELMWMEEDYKAFTPENILLHMKYLYDCDVDLRERATLRKITELDDIPQKNMILKVHDILFLMDRGYELELSDGFYKIRSTVDKAIAQKIDEKKIEINTKLIVSHASLINPSGSGCHPLDLPDSVRLKIAGNSTRVANDESKLGFCRNYLPFKISLNDVCGNG